MAEGAGDGVDIALGETRGTDEPAASADGPAERPTTNSEDALTRALEGRHFRRAAELCARLHGAALGRLCLAMLGSHSEAEEIAQETLLDAYRGFGGFRGSGTVRAWLFGIARKKCLKQLERRATQQRHLVLVSTTDSAPAVDDGLEHRERAERARDALYRLAHGDREALSLRYVAELSHADVASALGVDEATARKRVSRALGRLRNVLANGESEAKEEA